MKILSIFLLIIIFFLTIIPSSILYSLAENQIPDWVRFNAKWWAEGKISDDDYIAGLEFLINENIIKIKNLESILKTQKTNVVGSCINCSDYNGDGYIDIAIGSPGATIGEYASAGTVNVIYGSSNGLDPEKISDQLFHQNLKSIEGSPRNNANFGSSVK